MHHGIHAEHSSYRPPLRCLNVVNVVGDGQRDPQVLFGQHRLRVATGRRAALQLHEGRALPAGQQRPRRHQSMYDCLSSMLFDAVAMRQLCR